MRVEGELNIYTATTWKDRLLSLLASESSVELDLSAVNEFDSSGLQVLLLLQREARALGKPIRWLTPSRCVMDVVDLCFLREQFEFEGAPA